MTRRRVQRIDSVTHRISPSIDADTILPPTAAATPVTRAMCPSIVRTQLPLARSHSLTCGVLRMESRFQQLC